MNGAAYFHAAFEKIDTNSLYEIYVLIQWGKKALNLLLWTNFSLTEMFQTKYREFLYLSTSVPDTHILRNDGTINNDQIQEVSVSKLSIWLNSACFSMNEPILFQDSIQNPILHKAVIFP